MFNTFYRLRYVYNIRNLVQYDVIVSHKYNRLLVEETSKYFPIHLYALKEKEPTFNDLLKKVGRIIEEVLDTLHYHYLLVARSLITSHCFIKNRNWI
jgi:hypothetical protein